MLRPDQGRILKGAMYRVGARLASRQRSPDEWSISLLLGIHRDLFGSLFFVVSVVTQRPAARPGLVPVLS